MAGSPARAAHTGYCLGLSKEHSTVWRALPAVLNPLGQSNSQRISSGRIHERFRFLVFRVPGYSFGCVG